MRMPLRILYIVALSMILFIVWGLWSTGQFGNWGLEWGYYGQFNRVKRVLEEMPNVQITDSWQHHDITLEDFAFSLLVDETRTLQVTFHENSPQMKVRDASRIREFMEEKIRGDSNP
jgi:hypothetical protein